VIGFEATRRPDGARWGPPPFFDLLNGRKRSLAVDLRTAEGVATLAAVLARADVVIEASRPRALRQLGVHAEEVVATGRPRVWASITGYGRAAPMSGWVAFGDDAAVAGGLVARDADGPCFCTDAVADPTSGLVAAAAVLQALAHGGRWLLDVAMRDVAAHLAGPTLPSTGSTEVAAPRARPAVGRAPDLGEHTAEVLAELGIGR
jgi:crotonobetainyl-CoA:carnitine CoA-transferase CaiB-like acyl-CoA transferase